MEIKSDNFIPAASIAISNPELQAAVKKGTRNAYDKRLMAMFADGKEHGEAMRTQAAEAKRRALRNLPDLLEQAEAHMTENGIHVMWANDGEEVGRYVLQIAAQHGVKKIAKSKSMMTEEVGLNHILEARGIEVVETDLGEYIIQLNNEAPSHIIAPVIHKTKNQIRDIFMDKLDMPTTDDAETMVGFARQKLRDVFTTAEMGISGGNFIIAETGSVCLVTNEGNGRMVTSLPPVHIAIVGIEKVVATMDDYATLTQVLPRSGTGQNMTVYTSMINAPRQAGDADGPEHVYVILVDNGRSKIYATDYAEALACIRCGACLNGCPVYRATGGHAYGWVYGGPIGAVITPLLVGIENAKPLPHASSLCGTCKQVCPVNIDLPRMLLDLRHDLVEKGKGEATYNIAMKMWAMGNSSPRMFQMGGRAAQLGQKLLPGNNLPGTLGNWTKYRDFPDFAPKSFHQLWKERQQSKAKGKQAND